MARPRVLFLLHSGAIGGGPRFLRTLARLARQEGYAVRVLVGADGPLLGQLRGDGFEVETLPLGTARRFARSLPRLVARIRAFAPDLLHLHGQPAGSLGALAGRLAGVRRMLYAAQFPAFHTDFDPWRRARNHAVERVSAALSARVVCLSRWDIAEYRRRRLGPPARFVHIPNCVDPAILAHGLAPPHPRAAWGSPVVAFIGRLTDQKGADDLIRAIARIRARGVPARLVVTGEGPLREALERQARAEAPGAVAFRDAIVNPVPAFEEAHVVAMPSRFEPLGMVAAEALALGRPVVAARVGGLPDIVEDGVSGLLVPPGDPQALADALARLLADPELAEDLGARGSARVRRDFGEEAVLPRYRRLYAELLGS